MALAPSLGLLAFLLLVAIKGATMQSATTRGDLENVRKEQVVPDVIDSVPNEIVHVNYRSGAQVKLGNELTPSVVKDEPTIRYNAEPDRLYTVAMVDPDARSRREPILREILHWLVVNVPGDKVANGKTLAQYVGSGPPEGTGLHRYVFLVYKQTGVIRSDINISNRSREGRVRFSIRQFAKTNNLGQPMAVNFYQAQYDDYVPQLHKQLQG